MTQPLKPTTAYGEFASPGDIQTAIVEFSKALRTHRILTHLAPPANVDLQDYYRRLSEGAGSFVKRDENYLNGDQTEAQEDWMDIRFDALRQKESFRYSATRQPIHTDGAYLAYEFDISFFFCLVQAQYGGATTFIDGVALIDLLKKVEPEMLRELETHEVIFDKGVQQIKVRPVISYDDVGPLLNWNSFRISDKNSPEIKSLCLRFAEFCEKKIFETGLLTGIQLKPGEAVFFHDKRVLHGRNAFIGDRCLIKGGISL